MHKYILLLLTGMLLLVGNGCARESRQTSLKNSQINLTTVPYPPILGESRLVIQILDIDGTPVDNAQLDIKGDMTHAGMVPILAELDGGGEEGYYNVPIEWTMGGDWIISVRATLPDGSTTEERFDLRVTMGEDELCGDEIKDE
ncbi:MAG: FixH family protein [Candidatus Promineifilaceae bacterium]|nr:FixH family protein [Candidatus Promineifilaceae bacterium]